MKKELASHYKEEKLYSLYFLTPYIKREFQLDKRFKYKYVTDMLRRDMGKCISKLRECLNINKIQKQ